MEIRLKTAEVLILATMTVVIIVVVYYFGSKQKEQESESGYVQIGNGKARISGIELKHFPALKGS